MPKVVCWRPLGVKVSSSFPIRRHGGFDGAFVGFAEQGLELGKGHFDGVRVRAAGWQKQKMHTGVADLLASGQAFVAADVVGYDLGAPASVGARH